MKTIMGMVMTLILLVGLVLLSDINTAYAKIITMSDGRKDLVEAIRNGMDRQREEYQQSQPQQQFKPQPTPQYTHVDTISNHCILVYDVHSHL